MKGWLWGVTHYFVVFIIPTLVYCGIVAKREREKEREGGRSSFGGTPILVNCSNCSSDTGQLFDESQIILF